MPVRFIEAISCDPIQSKWHIVGNAKMTAVIHYSPPKEGSAIIDPKQIYLCDSGAQYLDGTTDTTRTLVCYKIDTCAMDPPRINMMGSLTRYSISGSLQTKSE